MNLQPLVRPRRSWSLWQCDRQWRQWLWLNLTRDRSALLVMKPSRPRRIQRFSRGCEGSAKRQGIVLKIIPYQIYAAWTEELVGVSFPITQSNNTMLPLKVKIIVWRITMARQRGRHEARAHLHPAHAARHPARAHVCVCAWVITNCMRERVCVPGWTVGTSDLQLQRYSRTSLYR